jgi:hypothetical protein
VRTDYGSGRATPKDARRALKKALDQAEKRARRTDGVPTPFCLVGQVRSGRDYAAQRRHWLRKARGWSAEGWAEHLPDGHYSVFVAPVSPDAAVRAREHPRPSAVPVQIEFNLVLPPESALAIATSVWLSQVAVRDFDAVALTPPVLEHYATGRLVTREVLDCGLGWPLPSPPLQGSSGPSM